MTKNRMCYLYTQRQDADESFDLFVHAPDRETALRLWREYAKDNEWDVTEMEDHQVSCVFCPVLAEDAPAQVVEWEDVEFAVPAHLRHEEGVA